MTRFFTATAFFAEAPIALCEVRVMFMPRSSPRASWLRSVGDNTAAQELKNQAKSLRRRFEEIF